MDSKIVLGSLSTSSITYEVTMYNSTEKEYLFIETITDKTDKTLYSNTDIEYSVNIHEYETTISPKSSMTFEITFTYKEGANLSNSILESKINFRFKEKPILNLSNEGQTYKLERIYAGYTSEEYEFTVTNYNESNINEVPMSYYFETTIEGPLTVQICDEDGNEITGEIEIEGDGKTKTTQTYKAKIIWNSEDNDAKYEGQQYECKINLKATPDDEKYMEYIIEKAFNMEITTNTTPTVTADTSNITVTGATITAIGEDTDGDELQYELVINDKIYGTYEENIWEITDLNPHTEYTYTITVTDGIAEAIATGKFTTQNTIPELTVDVTEIKATEVTITGTGVDADGDELEYTLEVNEKTYGPSKNNIWNITELTANKTYEYKVTVTDEIDETTKTGEFTTINSTPTLEVTVSDVGVTTATITAIGEDTDGDELEYTLEINETVYGPSNNNTWEVTGLLANTKYEYKVTVTDGIAEEIKIGELETGNTAPTLETETTNITTSEVTIAGLGEDVDGDELEYTLEINGQTYGPDIENTWTITELSPHTQYTYTITVTDGKTPITKTGEFTTLNTVPTVTIDTSNITVAGATITAEGEDADSDTLQYTLEINEKTYGPSETSKWDITGLSEGTKYEYKVTVTDGIDEVIKEGELETANKAPVISSVTGNTEKWVNTDIILSVNATDEGIRTTRNGI